MAVLVVRVIADVHTELIALYKTIGEGKNKELYKFMSEHPNEEKTYYEVRNMKSIDQIEIAARFYYLRKNCFRGMMRFNKKGEFNVSYGRYKTWNYENLKDDAYTNLLKNTEILSESFEKVFEKYNGPENFIFLDPPYDSTFTDYGYCKFGREHHEKLAECFKSSKSKCLMIIGGTDFIRELYAGYIVGEYDKKYKFRLKEGRVGSEIDMKHLIIKNY
jgi:DNA adenine methylase